MRPLARPDHGARRTRGRSGAGLVATTLLASAALLAPAPSAVGLGTADPVGDVDGTPGSARYAAQADLRRVDVVQVGDRLVLTARTRALGRARDDVRRELTCTANLPADRQLELGLFEGRGLRGRMVLHDYQAEATYRLCRGRVEVALVPSRQLWRISVPVACVLRERPTGVLRRVVASVAVGSPRFASYSADEARPLARVVVRPARS